MGHLQKSNQVMKFLLALAALCVVASAKPRRLPKIGLADGKIIGGDDAEPHAYPWQISLKNAGSHFCGGTIINERQVICAAHCVKGQVASFMTVVAGAHKLNFEFNHQKRNVESMEANANFDMQELADDISIITVDEPFDFSDPNVAPLEMFKGSVDEEIAPGTTCTSTGWGLTSGGGLFPPNTLQVVNIDILTFDECDAIFSGYIKPGMICAGKAGAAPCNGDSGGPLTCPDSSGTHKLAGIVSFGRNGCTSSGVYTRVSYYEDWISERLIA